MSDNSKSYKFLPLHGRFKFDGSEISFLGEIIDVPMGDGATERQARVGQAVSVR
jgi:hypothetical protein